MFCLHCLFAKWICHQNNNCKKQSLRWKGNKTEAEGNQPQQPSTLICIKWIWEIGKRDCHSRVGLFSHSRNCRWYDVICCDGSSSIDFRRRTNATKMTIQGSDLVDSKVPQLLTVVAATRLGWVTATSLPPAVHPASSKNLKKPPFSSYWISQNQ